MIWFKDNFSDMYHFKNVLLGNPEENLLMNQVWLYLFGLLDLFYEKMQEKPFLPVWQADDWPKAAMLLAINTFK